MDVYTEHESGYGSGSSSSSLSPASPKIVFTDIHLKHLNEQFERLSPQDILRLSKLIFPNLYQTTAFGLTGLVTLDMLSKLQAETSGSSPIEVIFLDTLYHFQETHELVARVRERYSDIRVHTFPPHGCSTASEFEERYGQKLWETDAEQYDYLAKVEPQQRSYEVLNVAAVLTGRRRSQGAARGAIPIIEIDSERGGIVKINPLANWSFDQVQDYIKTHNVPYNALLDRGYKSIGDWHSTEPVADGEDERAGRWKGQQKTECGIHNKKSRYAAYLMELANKQQAEEEAAAAAAAVTSIAGPLNTTAAAAAAAVPKIASARATEYDDIVPNTVPVPLSRAPPRVTKQGRKIGFSRDTWANRRVSAVQKLWRKAVA